MTSLSSIQLRMKEKNACPDKSLVWKREFKTMTCGILRYAPWVYRDEIKEIEYMLVYFLFSLCTFSYYGWLQGLWNIWEWTWRVINSNSTFTFFCSISQSSLSFTSTRPFLILTISLLPLTLVGKQNLHWFPRILCHSRRTRGFSMDFIMIFISRTKSCSAKSKRGNKVIKYDQLSW